MAAGLMEQHPTAAGQMLLALDFYLGPTPEIVIVGDPAEEGTAAVLREFRSRFVPRRVVACRSNGIPAGDSAAPHGHLDALVAGKVPAEESSPTVYVCQDFTCQAPVSGREAVIEHLNKLS